MIVIGLTGPSGSGKGTVGNYLANLGIPVIDTDAVYHKLIQEDTACLRELVQSFGTEILLPCGGLDRKKLAAIVFCGGAQQDENCAMLNRITHRYVLQEVRVWLAACRAQEKKAAVVDAPLLFESGFHKECGLVLSVLAEEDLRIKRICRRDGISKEAALARISAQKPDEFFRQNSDFVIENNQDEAFVAEQTETFCRINGIL